MRFWDSSALVAVADDPGGCDLVCLDSRLGEAARREGFLVIPTLSGEAGKKPAP